MADGDLEAGDFSSWLVEMRIALRGESPSDVPCGDCTACCTSSQFVHVGPDETDALAHIPPALLFPAPGMPGHVLLGYDERGHCPMLVDNRCSIYEHRPKTCRTYDCRIFPAAGVVVDDDGKALIARQARRWRFDHPAQADSIEHRAVEAAAAFLADHRNDRGVPTNATDLAVLAVEIHDAFLGHDEETGSRVLVEPDPEVVRNALSRRSTGPTGN